MKSMADDIDRSGLFDAIRNFSQRKLKKVETKVTTGSGELVTEKRGAKGVQTVKKEGLQGTGYVVDNKPDLQVGMIIPGLMISSQDVAQDKQVLDTYEITHILNLAYGVANSFEDDYNYKKLEILDVPETDIRKYFDECFEFIDDARHYGNCLVHCNAGVSRCTTICTAYLMYKEKKTFTDALNSVREARPFSKPNAGFMKQLEEYNEELYGGGQKDDKIEDAFTARKRAEIEAEKAAISGAASVKNKLKEFGAQLNSHFADRARSISPMNLPLKKKPVQNDIDRKVQPPEPQKKKPEVGKLRPEPPKLMKEPPKINKEPPKINKEPPKKLVINNDISKRQPIDSETSPNIDETPISVSAFRKNFELNNKNEIPKIHKIPATPKNNTIVNSPWNQSQSPSVAAPEEKKKKIIIKQRSKEIPEEPSKRRSTKDLVEAIERVNSPTTGVKPYRRTQTTQLEENKTNTTNSIATKPLDNKQPQPYRRTRNAVTEPPAPPPPPPPPVLPQEKSSPRTIKLTKQSSTSSPTYTPTQTPTPTSNRSNSRSPQVSHSPSPTPYAKEEPQDSQTGPQKMVFGRVPPKRLSICGRTLSQASQNISDVSNKVTNNDSTTSSISGHSASNSRSESPVLSAVVKPHNRDTDAEKADKTIKNNKMPAQELSDNMVAKRTALSQLNKQLNVENSCSPSASSVDSESSDEELVPTVPIMKSTLTMQLKPNNKNTVKEPEIMPINDIKLTQTKEPSIDNQSVVNRVPLGETKDRQQSFDKNKSKSGLTRSSTAKILNLIKTKSRHDLGLGRVEEDDEIESLLMELEKEGVDNIDWDEIGIDSEEVMDIVNEAKTEDSSDSKESSDEDSSDDEDSDSDDEAVHMVINRQAPQQESEVSDDEFEVVEDEEESD